MFPNVLFIRKLVYQIRSFKTSLRYLLASFISYRILVDQPIYSFVLSRQAFGGFVLEKFVLRYASCFLWLVIIT